MRSVIAFPALLILLLLSSHARPQELNRNARYIRATHEALYKSTIRKHALDKWGIDCPMAVYEINRQSDALLELIRRFESKHTRIVYNAIIRWSVRGYETQNRRRFGEINAFGLEQLLGFHCDWTMVLYEYDRLISP